MMTELAQISRTRTRDQTTTWTFQRDTDSVPLPETTCWYGALIVERPEDWNSALADLAFPRIRSSSSIDRRVGTPLFRPPPIAALPVARQVRELQAALSVNKSELARILRVTRPTVYDWLDEGEPNADNVERIQQLLRLLVDAGVSASTPLFPRLVRFPEAPYMPALLDLLCEETVDEAAAERAIHRAKALGDAVDREREAREDRLRAAGFEPVDTEQRRANLALNVALLDWPSE